MVSNRISRPFVPRLEYWNGGFESSWRKARGAGHKGKTSYLKPDTAFAQG
jgi:hypothetical protein